MRVYSTILVLVVRYIIELRAVGVLPSESITYDDSGYLLKSVGCKIPKFEMKYKIVESSPLTVCGARRIIINKLKNNYITFYFIEDMQKCRYRFLYGTKRPKEYATIFGQWHDLTNGTKAKLRSDFVFVQCGTGYEDVLTNIMKQEIQRRKTVNSWNVLMLGLDSMSRGRAIHTLPRAVSIMRAMNFLDFRTYTISGNYSTGNLKGMLSVQTQPFITHTCNVDPEACSNLWIWNDFQAAGYVTARGDDGIGINIDDTITSTHHLLKPVFSTPEKRHGNVYCTTTLTTGEHVLNYAFDFAETYHKTNKFFGFFWTGRHTSDTSKFGDTNPKALDAPLTMFLQKLWYDGLLEDTFLILFSNNGLKFGQNMLYPASHYDNRLPMLYIRPPTKFKDGHFDQYLNLVHNQHRLITPYDVYLTLWDILTNFDNPYDVPTHKSCPKCTSLLSDLSKFRTCARINIEPQWCPCHELIEVTDSTEMDMILDLIRVNQIIPRVVIEIETIPCTYCAPLELKTVLRLHKYIEWTTNYTHYEVALGLQPNNVGMEISMVIEDKIYKVIGIRPITNYDKRKTVCVKKTADKHFCTCVRKADCDSTIIN